MTKLPEGEPVTLPDSAAEPAPAATPLEDNEMPLPGDPKTVFLGGLFILGLLAAAYVAQVVVLPIILAFILKLLCQPLVRLGERARLPRVLTSLLVIVLLLVLLGGLYELLSTPAANWAKRLPEGLPLLEKRIRFISMPMNSLQHFAAHAQGVVAGAGTPSTASAARAATAAAAATSSGGLHAALLSGAHALIAGFITTLLVLFFLLMSSDTFLRRLVEVLPRFRDKRQAIDIAWQVEADISSYLVTITCMNLLVGIATGLVMWALGLPNPLLWAVVAFLLNYVPILGPLTGMVIFFGVGMLSVHPLWKAFMPMVCYIAIHLTEGETITPLILARRFTINPVLVIIALLFWDWMWGIPGAVLAVPMLAITKIICDRVRPLAAFGHFLEGEKLRGLKP